MVMAGGGIKGGTIVGASDAKGTEVLDDPVKPEDVAATIYHCLGVPNDLELHDRQRRPFQLVPWGNPIQELLS